MVKGKNPTMTLIIIRFCDHHTSGLFNDVTLDIWNRILKVVTETQALLDQLQPMPLKGSISYMDWGLKEIVKNVETSHINVWNLQNEDNDPEWEEYFASKPATTACPGKPPFQY